MTRFLPIGVGTLVASFFLSVFIAWGCMVLVPAPGPDESVFGFSVSGPSSWTVDLLSGRGQTWILSTRAKGHEVGRTRWKPGLLPEHVLPSWGNLGMATPAFNDEPVREWRIEGEVIHSPPVHEVRAATAAGWPFRCLWCEHEAEITLGGDTVLELPTAGYLKTNVVLSDGFKRVLPLRPIALGLAANTVLYAATMLACGFGASWLRRLVRRRRGCCERCGYRSGASDRCPECGHARASRPVPA